MRLRTTAGGYAGQIRDYSYTAGLAALRTGTAEPIDAVRPVPVARQAETSGRVTSQKSARQPRLASSTSARR